jgi:hypothetical protein
MSKSVPNRLGGLIQPKGAAQRPVEMPQRGDSAPAQVEAVQPAPATVPTPDPEKPSQQKTSLTVKLDPDQYERLRGYGFRKKMKHQQIMVTALMRFLDSEGA